MDRFQDSAIKDNFLQGMRIRELYMELDPSLELCRHLMSGRRQQGRKAEIFFAASELPNPQCTRQALAELSIAPHKCNLTAAEHDQKGKISLILNRQGQ
jgi:hypothetical protein